MARHIWLVGMMGTGKSTVGRLAADLIGIGLVDTDAEIASRTGCSIAQLWGEQGEAAFRNMEAAAVIRAADGADAVIATGGGVVLDPDNVAAMKHSGNVVWLTAPVRELAKRIGDGAGRPLLEGTDTRKGLAALLARRWSSYEQAADLILPMGGRTPEAAASRIEELWNAS